MRIPGSAAIGCRASCFFLDPSLLFSARPRARHRQQGFGSLVEESYQVGVTAALRVVHGSKIPVLLVKLERYTLYVPRIYEASLVIVGEIIVMCQALA